MAGPHVLPLGGLKGKAREKGGGKEEKVKGRNIQKYGVQQMSGVERENAGNASMESLVYLSRGWYCICTE